MTTDNITDRQIYEGYKREGEEWVEFKNLAFSDGYNPNPNFSTPDGMAWILERMGEKDIETSISTTEEGEEKDDDRG
jgi:hypothetical protein